MIAPGDLVIVGDVHLDRNDRHGPAFVEFLGSLGSTVSRLVLLGDLFNLWIGDRDLEQPHQKAVIAALADLRRRGVVVRYMEGNRDYRIGAAYAGTAFDDVVAGEVVERHGGRSLALAHGDLVNVADRNYRAWRAFSRSAPVWGLFQLLPRRRRFRVAESLERRLRGTNVAMKSAFPERAVRDWAARRLAAGHDVVVLGHFHDEFDRAADPPSAPGRIVVVPLWTDARRYLRVGPGGDIAFDRA